MRTNLLFFLILILITLLLQYLLLRLVFNYGFTPDDWGLLLFYKTLGDNPLSKIAYVWSIKGAYTTSQVYFIGILNSFFGLNYQYYQITNIILKTLATLSLYPLILIIFKKRLLAFLTTFLYGISYMASRSLEYAVKGTDYLAIIPMNLFLIVYFFIVREKLTKLRWFFLMSFLWFTSLMISPIRLYPILALIPLIELILWLQNRSRKMISNSLKRLSILYIPLLLIYLYKPGSIAPFLQNPRVLYQAILKGNWHLILTPFQGVGLTVFVTNYWNRVFGDISLNTLHNYLFFLLGGPLVIFGVFAYFLSLIKFKRRLKGFITILCISLFFFMLSFLIANHLYGKTEVTFDPNRMYASLIGGFILAISFACFLEWRREGRDDNVLLALWVSPPIILLYTLLIWILAPLHTGFDGQQGYYLVLPAIASSLFLAAILSSIYFKALTQSKKFFKFATFLIFFVCLVFLHLTNSFNTYNYYLSAGKDGRLAYDQDRIYNLVMGHRDNLNYNEPTIFYFDVSEDAQKSTYYYEESLFHSLPIRILLRDEKIHDGCIGIFYRGIDNLAKLITIKTGQKGFIYQGQCIINGIGGNTQGIFYKIENFYAFKIKGRELIDTKEEVLEKLSLK